ncbi:acyltransferase family protein [Edaphobacter modestus]|uniref:Peptidoglycan/LPS O-acetylase OafA/YrhL n=1 Tax=Edaphobacter modestus TaxID=388466 RepID=A0A4Q7YYD7_9BACT|nr:acyltransferase [Edaphobacter modestus]RZU42768.1 peptidoglycan/LPS O-acetylase OafA/YrhL [Edaphobacter modestus]
MRSSPTTSMTRDWGRIDGVDLLRGLSILFVLMNHVNMRLLSAKVPYTKGLSPQLVSSLVWNGQFGVQMFFVISGFLITSTSIRRWGSLHALSVKDFYVLRFARIAPLLLLLLCILSGLHLAHVTGYVVSPKTGGLGRALLAALTFHINLLEATRDYLPASWDILWSLSVEEMFYLFFPLAVRLLRTKKLLIPLLMLFVIVGPFARARAFNPNPVWREYSYLGGMDAIALGCLTALLLSNKRLSRPSIRLSGIAGFALLTFSLCFSIKAYTWGLGRNGLNMTVLAIGTSLTIAAATQSSWRAPRLLSPLLILGRNSYEIYLTHVFVVMALFEMFVHLGKPLQVVPLLFITTIGCAGVLGSLVAAFYSEPMNRTIRRKAAGAASAPEPAIPAQV